VAGWPAHAQPKPNKPKNTRADSRFYCVQVATEASIVVLLVGTLISGIQQAGETMASGIAYINPNAPGAFIDGNGRLLMLLSIVCIMFPLVLLSRLSSVRCVRLSPFVYLRALFTSCPRFRVPEHAQPWVRSKRAGGTSPEIRHPVLRVSPSHAHIPEQARPGARSEIEV
jgi:hypothetical protein